MLVRLLALLVSLALASPLAAQLEPVRGGSGPATVERLQGSDTSAPGTILLDGSPTRPHTTREIVFSVGVLFFGLVLVLLFTQRLLKEGTAWRGTYLRLVVLSIVVTAGLFVITAGYDQDQIAPMMGLLGTLVGYLLGRESSPPPPEPPARRTEGGG
jgi:hypothetical protein